MSAPSHFAMVTNITSIYLLATALDIDVGSHWYLRAYSLVLEWADTFNRPIANVACVIAALSPQLEWNRNLIIADDLLHGHPPSIGGAIRRNIRLAERIRDDRATDTANYFKQGCKVRSFAVNLAGNFDIVTVDTHSAQIAAGSPLANLRVDTWKKYQPVHDAYVNAARLARLQPAILQAIVWCAWKRLYPQGKKIHLRSRW